MMRKGNHERHEKHEKHENGLVPKLRFPEFRDAGEWESKKLGDTDVADFVKTRISLGELSIETYVSTENILPDFGGIAKASKLPPSGSFTSYKPGDILIANIRPYLKKIWVANRIGGASNDVVVVRPKKNRENTFLSSLLKNEAFINYVMQGAKGVKMPRGDIALMKEYPIALPNPEEQQKIADCLSSLDELIAAHTKKFEALQSYKKGLMQNLFPAEGKTVPALRFPEFEGAGEWNTDIFVNYIEIIDGDRGKNYPKSEEFSDDGYCLFLNAKNVTKNGFVFEEMQFITEEKDNCLRKGKLKRDDVVLTTRGSVGQFAYFSDEIPYKDIRINSGMVLLRSKSKSIRPDYLYMYCRSESISNYIENIAFGNAQQQLTVAGIKSFPLSFPSVKEQQKIADSLSSVDELITAQAQKIEDLKAHKKGLMQQLFPATEGGG